MDPIIQVIILVFAVRNTCPWHKKSYCEVNDKEVPRTVTTSVTYTLLHIIYIKQMHGIPFSVVYKTKTPEIHKNMEHLYQSPILPIRRQSSLMIYNEKLKDEMREGRRKLFPHYFPLFFFPLHIFLTTWPETVDRHFPAVIDAQTCKFPIEQNTKPGES